MIVYFKCLCRSADKLLAKKLRDEGYEVRDIRNSLEWRKEAKSYGLKMPFKVINGVASEL